MKKIKDSFFGTLATIGLVLIMCCDTDTEGQLVWILFLGFGFLLFGGRGLIINNQR